MLLRCSVGRMSRSRCLKGGSRATMVANSAFNSAASNAVMRAGRHFAQFAANHNASLIMANDNNDNSLPPSLPLAFATTRISSPSCRWQTQRRQPWPKLSHQREGSPPPTCTARQPVPLLRSLAHKHRRGSAAPARA
eukprot:COSAG06_NODE_255_length_19038_cov_16.597381_8_plen_137_part_00